VLRITCYYYYWCSVTRDGLLCAVRFDTAYKTTCPNCSNCTIPYYYSRNCSALDSLQRQLLRARCCWHCALYTLHICYKQRARSIQTPTSTATAPTACCVLFAPCCSTPRSTAMLQVCMKHCAAKMKLCSLLLKRVLKDCAAYCCAQFAVHLLLLLLPLMLGMCITTASNSCCC
jgi:hypothetical protein